MFPVYCSDPGTSCTTCIVTHQRKCISTFIWDHYYEYGGVWISKHSRRSTKIWITQSRTEKEPIQEMGMMGMMVGSRTRKRSNNLEDAPNVMSDVRKKRWENGDLFDKVLCLWGDNAVMTWKRSEGSRKRHTTEKAQNWPEKVSYM